MRAACHGIRKKGTGSIHRAGIRWEAEGPSGKDGRKVYLGRFDTAREAERAIAEYIASTKKEVA
jgi:hypothetical protein